MIASSRLRERVFYMAGQAIERGQSIDHVVGLCILLLQLVQMLARRHVVAHVHQRDGVVEVLFRRLELGGSLAPDADCRC